MIYFLMAAGLAVRKGLEAPVTGEAQGSAGCDEGLESSGYVVLVHEGRAPGDPPPSLTRAQCLACGTLAVSLGSHLPALGWFLPPYCLYFPWTPPFSPSVPVAGFVCGQKHQGWVTVV